MRQKINTHTSLKSGCSFYYRDIFSGLSNEKMSPALCYCIPAQVPCNRKHRSCTLNPSFHVEYPNCSSNPISLYHHASNNMVAVHHHLSLVLSTIIIPIKFKIMTTGKPTLAYTIAYYEPLLQRYARRIINNTTLAAKLVRQVLEDQ